VHPSCAFFEARLFGDPTVERLVKLLPVVEPEAASQAPGGGPAIFMTFQAHLLVFPCPPKALDEDVVEAPAPACGSEDGVASGQRPTVAGSRPGEEFPDCEHGPGGRRRCACGVRRSGGAPTGRGGAGVRLGDGRPAQFSFGDPLGRGDASEDCRSPFAGRLSGRARNGVTRAYRHRRPVELRSAFPPRRLRKETAGPAPSGRYHLAAPRTSRRARHGCGFSRKPQKPCLQRLFRRESIMQALSFAPRGGGGKAPHGARPARDRSRELSSPLPRNLMQKARGR